MSPTYLGVMYLRGRGVPQNFAVAAYWLHLASAAGLPTAQYFSGSRLPADDPTHRRIMAQPLGVVHVLVSCKPPEHRLP